MYAAAVSQAFPAILLLHQHTGTIDVLEKCMQRQESYRLKHIVVLARAQQVEESVIILIKLRLWP